jgi:hypothetical protein
LLTRDEARRIALNIAKLPWDISLSGWRPAALVAPAVKREAKEEWGPPMKHAALNVLNIFGPIVLALMGAVVALWPPAPKGNAKVFWFAGFLVIGSITALNEMIRAVGTFVTSKQCQVKQGTSMAPFNCGWSRQTVQCST